MIFTFGTGFYGKVANHNNHWIETKCFHVMFIPLFPVSSMFVTASEFRRREGFDMSLNTKSVIAIYARLFSGLLAAYLLFLSYIYLVESRPPAPFFTMVILGAIASVAAWVYFCFFYGKPNADDIAMREKVKTVSGMYALPHWFEHSFLWKMLEVYEKKYKQQYPDSNWETDLNKTGLDRERIRLLYGIALFNCMVNNSPENDELYVKADNLYTR